MSVQSLPTLGYRSTWDWDQDDKEFAEHIDWYEANLSIVDESDQIVPLKLNDQQKALEYYKWRCEREGRSGWALILKARKLGCSTWAEGTFFRDGLERANTRAYVIAHDDDSTGFIFEMTQIFHANLDEKIKPPLTTSSAKEMRFAHNGSSFRIRTAGAGGRAGRAGTFTKVHFSELDKWPAPEELYGAVVNSIPDTPGVFVVAESTADGPLLLMQQLWDQAVEGRNEFMPFFFPWWQSPKYRRAVTWGDLRSYAPREWLAKNKKFIDQCEKAHLELISGKVEDDDVVIGNGPPGTSGPRRVQGSPEKGPRAPGQGSRGTTGEAGGSGSQKRVTGDASTEEGEGTGPVSGKDVHRGDEVRPDDGRDRPKGSSGLREFRKGRGNGGITGRWLPPRFHVGDVDQDTSGGDGEDRRDFRAETGRSARVRRFSAETVFRESLTPYEIGLIDAEGLDLEQINWLRYCLEHRCKGDDTRRRREYPSYPAEAFEATGSDVLDPRVLSLWTKEAKENPPVGRGSMRAEINRVPDVVEKVFLDGEDKTGHVEIYAYPNAANRYVLAVDAAQGVADGDFHVGSVVEVETGDQVAEYRSKVDPDLAVDQLEWLGLWYNKAFTLIEMNGGYGVPFMRHFADRQTLPLYEREALDRQTRQFTKRPGWITSVGTRSALFSELKYSVRMEKVKIRALETLKEARTLWQNTVGKIEARPGHHDDGIMAFGIALMGRNYLLGLETVEREKERQAKSPVAHFNKLLKKQMREERKTDLHKIKSTLPIKRKGRMGRRLNRDRRRSRI